jgi:hypothetical protein
VQRASSLLPACQMPITSRARRINRTAITSLFLIPRSDPPTAFFRCATTRATLPEYYDFSTSRLFRGLKIVSAMSNSPKYVSADLLKEVGVDASEAQPLLAVSAPHDRPAEMSRSYPFSHGGDSNIPFATNAVVVNTSPNKEHVDLFSGDGKSSTHSTWNPQSRATSLSGILGPRKTTLAVGSTMLLSLAAIWFLALRNGLFCQASSSNAHHLVNALPPPEVQHSWGAYTPYFSAEHYTPPPPNCRISQVR